MKKLKKITQKSSKPRPLLVFVPESLHEVDESLSAFDGHGIVHGGSAATSGLVPTKLEETLSSRLSDELLFQLLIAVCHPKRDVHPAPVPLVHRVAVVPLRAVDEVVE
jgi:hypothetical protein